MYTAPKRSIKMDFLDDDLNGCSWAAMEPAPTPRERELLDLFASQYLIDHNATLAASRCGFGPSFAKEYGKRFIERSYVQRKIQELKNADGEKSSEEEYDRRLIKNTLREIAGDPSASQRDRVAAASKLAAYYISEENQRSKNSTGLGNGGVMQVPEIANLDDWEKVAQAHQEKLAADAKADQ